LLSDGFKIVLAVRLLDHCRRIAGFTHHQYLMDRLLCGSRARHEKNK